MKIGEEKITDFESWSAGYRMAVLDLKDLTQPSEREVSKASIWVAYILGFVIGMIVLKYGSQ